MQRKLGAGVSPALDSRKPRLASSMLRCRTSVWFLDFKFGQEAHNVGFAVRRVLPLMACLCRMRRQPRVQQTRSYAPAGEKSAVPFGSIQ